MGAQIVQAGSGVRVVVENPSLAEVLQRLVEIEGKIDLVLAGGSVSPLPLPAFTSAPTISSDGTPQVGEQLVGFDAAVSNLGSNTLTRAWLLGTTVYASTSAYTPNQTGTFIFRNQIVAPDGTVLASANVNVVVGAATPAPTPSPTISFTSPSISVTEGSGTQTVSNTVNVNRDGLTGALTVNLAYGGTATAGTDYVAGPASVTIAAGANSASFNLTVNGDTTVEPDETIIITATLAGYSASATKTITVTNDDASGPHKLLAPTVEPSTPEDSTSVAWQLTPAPDDALSDDGYTGFGLKLERADDAAFSQGYVTEMVVITSPTFNEGLMRRDINHNLVPGKSYWFGFTIVPPSGQEASYTASDRTVKTATIAAAVSPVFNPSDGSGNPAFSNNNRTMTSTANVETIGRTANNHPYYNSTDGGEFDYWLEVDTGSATNGFLLGVADDQGRPCVFIYNDDAHRTVPQFIAGNGSGSNPPLDIDSGFTLAAGRAAVRVNTKTLRISLYVGAKHTAEQSMYGDSGFVNLRGQVIYYVSGVSATLVPTSFKPSGVTDWKSA